MGRGRRRRNDGNDDNGFGVWGGYMAAKKSKLLDQFKTDTIQQVEKQSDIFSGVAIIVNGLTHPNADELKLLMASHGGTFHTYQSSSTTHIIASNLPNVKINKLGSTPIVKPSWITDSITMGRLLDYKRYLLYTNQSTSQPRLEFPVIPKTDNVTESVTNENVKPSTSSAQGHHFASTKTASDPQFLQEFYNNSRLHLISSLGAEYKQLVGKLRDESDGKFPGLDFLKNLSSNKNLENSERNVDDFLSKNDCVIMHIDMDCFFVSVGLRNRPELRGKPVAVTHARNPHVNATKERSLEIAMNVERLPQRMEHLDANSSMSEIASCSYEARKCGIKNGMFLGAAIKLCPDLKTISYDFEGYKEVSNTLYRTIASYTLNIEAVSCDEMYVDVSDILKISRLTVDEWANHIRTEIRTKTGCPCSTGFGANRLQARLATKKAKPNGQYHLRPEDVESHMFEIPLFDLPGVGRATLAKLASLGLNTCGDLQSTTLHIIQSELGPKAGETLWEQARGIDRRPLNFHHERKSVSAEVNYGIRFKTAEECYNFLESLSVEVCSRLNEIKMRARCVTLKVMVRAEGAPVETAKFLGHGICDCLSKSSTTNGPVSDPKSIFKEAKNLYDKLNLSYEDLRGLGIQLTKLEKIAPVNAALTRFLQQTTKVPGEPRNAQSKEKEEGELKIEFQAPAKTEKSGEAQNKTPSSNIREVASQQASAAKGKKGRPKGSLSAKNVSNNAKHSETSMSRFFRSKKETGSPFDSEIKNKIDLNVLKELPTDLQKEIMREYKLDNDFGNVALKNVQGGQHVKNKPATSAVKTSETSTNLEEQKSPFAGLTWPELKPILRNWIDSEREPSTVDTDMLGQHFRELALNHQIEMLKVALNFLHRNFTRLDCKWHTAYFRLVDVTQEGMLAIYGGVLQVNRDFGCCRN